MNKDQQPASKDIVYIDVEDDVTNVIGKVRASGEKIVALVPPKNIGALQSAVNLRLLMRAADNAGKRIVLITNNPGLTALAAGVKIPIAKNLQSKPEIPVLPSIPAENDDDVIKGEDLPVGELAAASTAAAAVEPELSVVAAPAALKAADDDIIITEMPDLDSDAPVAAAAVSAKKKEPEHGTMSKVPNFNRFRKVIFIGGGLLVAIIAFFVLTNIFWTSATVVITAQSTDEGIDLPLTLTADGATNPDQSTIKSVTKTLKKTASVDFTPTGKKDVGAKATGTVKFSTNNIGSLGTTIPAGTELTASGGSAYTTDSAVTITLTNYQGANADITAKIQGTSSNGASGSLNGAPSGISAALVGSTSGGTDKTITVVSAGDIAAATAKLTGSDAAAAKTEVTSQFGSDFVIITDSFNAQNADPVSTPAVDTEATTAKLTRDSTYTLTAVAKSDVKTVTTAYLTGTFDGSSQKIYDDGSSSAHVSQFVTSPSGVQTMHLLASGKVGPNIDDAKLKTQLVGLKSAEITQKIRNINGVKDVAVKFAPFWRSTAPKADKINISFELNSSTSDNGN